jgi:hypothetical protein
MIYDRPAKEILLLPTNEPSVSVGRATGGTDGMLEKRGVSETTPRLRNASICQVSQIVRDRVGLTRSPSRQRKLPLEINRGR